MCREFDELGRVVVFKYEDKWHVKIADKETGGTRIVQGDLNEHSFALAIAKDYMYKHDIPLRDTTNGLSWLLSDDKYNLVESVMTCSNKDCTSYGEEGTKHRLICWYCGSILIEVPKTNPTQRYSEDQSGSKKTFEDYSLNLDTNSSNSSPVVFNCDSDSSDPFEIYCYSDQVVAMDSDRNRVYFNFKGNFLNAFGASYNGDMYALIRSNDKAKIWARVVDGYSDGSKTHIKPENGFFFWLGDLRKRSLKSYYEEMDKLASNR